MKIWVRCLSIAASCCFAGTAAAADLLFVQQTGNPGFDALLMEHLEENHNVLPIDSADPDILETAEQVDVIYVAESIGSASIIGGDGTIFQDLEVPVIYAEAFSWDDSHITGLVTFEDFGNSGRPDATEAMTETSDSIYITDPGHPMAAGLSGKVQVYSDPFSLNYALIETMGPGASIIATADEDGQYATSFVYEAGSELEDGSIAPARRIGIFLGQGSSLPDNPLIDFDNLTADALSLIDAAVSYAVDTVTLTPGDFDGDGILGAADIDDLTAQSAGSLNPPAYDLNADSLVNQADVEVWIKDLLHSWVGDADLNGQFDSSDLVSILAAGTYEADVNAVWTTGDFSGDARANSADLVAALADGGYELGPRAATASVPEPATLTLLTLSLLVLATRRLFSTR
jgi:hypothetical protein